MLRPVVQHVAALAKGCEIAGAVVGRVMVPMGGGEHYPRRPDGPEDVVAGGETNGPPRTVAPGGRPLVPPPPVAEVKYRTA